jgi:RNA polymerase sigma factor (sigma-70 family)
MADDSQMRTRASLLMRLRQDPADPAAWDEFVDHYGGQITEWCRQWRLQPADAEDVSQNVLLKLAQRLRTFVYDPGQRFRGFLRTMAHNACKDYLDSQQRAVPASGDRKVHLVLDSVAAREDLVARLEATFDLERLEWAQARVRGRVEPHTWDAFCLTALEGKSGAEAAALLHMQVGTVFKAKSKVQQMLREEVERLESEEPIWMSALAVPNSNNS